MTKEWPTPEEIVDWYSKQSGNYPYPAFSIYCRFTSDETIEKIRNLILRTEVGTDTFGLYRLYSNQDYKLSVPIKLLRDNRELYTVIIREVLATDSVQQIGYFN